MLECEILELDVVNPNLAETGQLDPKLPLTEPYDGKRKNRNIHMFTFVSEHTSKGYNP